MPTLLSFWPLARARTDLHRQLDGLPHLNECEVLSTKSQFQVFCQLVIFETGKASVTFGGKPHDVTQLGPMRGG